LIQYCRYGKEGGMGTKGEVLLIDNDGDIRDCIRIVLESNGYTVKTAVNGREALEVIKSKAPDLIISELMMAIDTDGFNLACEFGNGSIAEKPPIIILTCFPCKVRDIGQERFRHILGDEWPPKRLIEKPVEPRELLAKIESVLHGK
jgi:two-component system alkaline phosphatase synthesis response regulator PhoP